MDAEISKREGAEKMDQGDADMERNGDDNGWNHGGGRPDEERDQSEQRGGHEHGKQGQDEDVNGEGEDRDAVEIDGHGEGHC